MKAPQRGFATPPEIKRFFDDKALRPAFSYLDVWNEEHAHAFTVAKAVELELLAAFRNSLSGALARGESFETWRAGLIPELQRLGWYGPRRVDDPTGQWKSKIVDFSRPARLQTIFWANVRSARAAGQWERAQRTKAGLPYFLYVRTTSVEPRQEHLAWAGVMLPVDDPFWATHFPPNGWGCKCSVRQIARAEYARLKDAPGYSTDRPPTQTVMHQNRRTGEITSVPEGIDPGWGTNPGLARAKTLVANYTARLEAAGEEAARKSIADFVASPAPRWLATLDGLELPAAVALRRIVTVDSTLLARSAQTMQDGQPLANGMIAASDLPKVQSAIDEALRMAPGDVLSGRMVIAKVGAAAWRLALSAAMKLLAFIRD